jgi:predicted dehydrogenase
MRMRTASDMHALPGVSLDGLAGHERPSASHRVVAQANGSHTVPLTRGPLGMRGSTTSVPHPEPVRVALLGGHSYAADAYVAVLKRLSSISPGTTAFVARVHPYPTWSPAGLHAPTFATLDALIASGIEVDLLLVASWLESQAPLIRRALGERWHVVCDDTFTDDPAEAAALLALARSVDRSLIAGPPSGFLARRLAELDPAGTLGVVTTIDAAWTRPAADMPADTQMTDPGILVEELLPGLLSVALPFFGAATPTRVDVWRSPPGEVPRAKVTVDVGAGARLTLDLAHDPVAGGRDGASMRIAGARTIEVNPAVPLAECYAAQLGIGVLAVTGGAESWCDPSALVRAVMDAASRSIASGGRAVDVR